MLSAIGSLSSGLYCGGGVLEQSLQRGQEQDRRTTQTDDQKQPTTSTGRPNAVMPRSCDLRDNTLPLACQTSTGPGGGPHKHTHHGHFVPLDADVGPFEVGEGSDGRDTGGIHQVAVMVQHVNIHSDLPHLGTDKSTS